MTDSALALDVERIRLAVGRSRLASEVDFALNERCGVAPSDRIIVGFSGGGDSTALLMLLHVLARRGGVDRPAPVVLHVDHGLRPDSAEEAAHAVAVCRAFGIECHVTRLEIDADSGDLARRARDARYQALQSCAHATGCEVVVVGHHAEDRFESMLQSLCRGVGVNGLSQPRWVRPLGQVRLARPLLGISRAELVALCTESGLPYLSDPTNDRVDTARGLLRAQVLDVLEERWPGAARRASAAADRLHMSDVALERLLDEEFNAPHALEWSRSVLSTKNLELLGACLRSVILHRAPELADALPASILEQAARSIRDGERRPRVFELTGGWHVEIDARMVRVRPPLDRTDI